MEDADWPVGTVAALLTWRGKPLGGVDTDEVDSDVIPARKAVVREAHQHRIRALRPEGHSGGGPRFLASDFRIREKQSMSHQWVGHTRVHINVTPVWDDDRFHPCTAP